MTQSQMYSLGSCFNSVQLLSHAQLFATPWTAVHQASLSITHSWSLLKLMSIELVMPFNHFILFHPLLLLPPILPSIRVFSNESTLRMQWPKYWSFSFSIIPSKEIPGLISIFYFYSINQILFCILNIILFSVRNCLYKQNLHTHIESENIIHNLVLHS